MSIADEQRVTLPARAYVDRDIFEAELDDVFARAWIFVCPERVVAEPGSFATANVAGEPVAVVRGDDGELRPATWEHALATAAKGLREVKERHGPQSIGVLASARLTMEENFLIQKLARTALGTHSVHSCEAT